jgi:hypothetical protein
MSNDMDLGPVEALVSVKPVDEVPETARPLAAPAIVAAPLEPFTARAPVVPNVIVLAKPVTASRPAV